MRVALLPPQPELSHFEASSEIHLTLNHWMRRATYRDHYAKLAARGHYVIVDNSAHEHGNGTQISSLMRNAELVQAREIVLPDTLDDGEATLARSREAMDWLLNESSTNGYPELSPRLMLVPQGKDRRDWETCLFGLCQKWQLMHSSEPELFAKPPVIGMSKDYAHFPGGIAELVQRQLYPLFFRHGFDVHLLGWGRELYQLDTFANRFPWIRSTDSAKPFVYAKKGIVLDPEHEPEPPEYPGRPKEYIDWEFNPHQREIAKHNVGVFTRLASGVYTSVFGA